MKTKMLQLFANNLKKAVLLSALCLLPAGFVSCSNDDDPEPEIESPVEPKTFSFVSTSTAPDEWVYFSFEKGDIVNVDKANADKDQTWDIAFQRFYVRTNSGTSGEGNGGALDMNYNKKTAYG